jgi:putative membrane protein
VQSRPLHAFEHASFIATSVLFWWMALGASRRSRRGLGVLVVFVASLPASALGIVMTLARTSWYGPYGSGAAALGRQQVAGSIMWGFGGSALVLAAAALFASWLASMERLEPSAAQPPPPAVRSS